MLKNVVTSIFGTRFNREVKRVQPLVDQIHEHEARLGQVSDAEIQAQTGKFRERLHERLGALEGQIADLRAKKHACADPVERDDLDRELQGLEERMKTETAAALDDLLPEAFATVREACRRLVGTSVVVTGHELTWDMVPYDVQLIGGIVLHQGKIAEMATGEGKTLVATLPIYLNALPGRGVHLITVNDYLARRDSQWMGHLFTFLGLTVACVDDTQPSSPQRREAYRADVTYGTNNEFGFDYLRDNMVFSLEQRVQRSHTYAIVDEVDSILIDEARTPLIISGPVGNEEDKKYAQFNTQVRELARKQTGVVNQLIAEAESLIEKDPSDYQAHIRLFKAQRGSPKNKKLMKLLQEPGLQQAVQRVDLDYIADRKLPAKDQKLRDVEEDLYFVLDERGHSVHLTDKGVDVMSPGDPTLFVIPDISEEVGRLERDESFSADDRLRKRQELEAEYAAKSEKLHIIHKLLQAYALYEKDVEYVVQEGQVFIVDEFTGRIMHGRRWSDGLHQAVEAKEGVTVKGETQTLATITIQNYFRMYDKLSGMTGTAETEETEFFQIYGLEVMVIPTNRPVRRIDKHDLIYKTRREKYNAIIDEVVRQHERGLPVLVGTVSVEVSETLARMLKRRGIKHEVLNAKYHQREAEIVTQAGRAGSVTIATNMAGRGTDIKLGPGVKKCKVCGITAKLAPFGQQLEKPDLDDAEIKRLGCNDDPPCGLVIIGTERHESRRIDRQLRGRSGRQGDPGESIFYLSLEDDLMRLFGSDRIARWMDRTGGGVVYRCTECGEHQDKKTDACKHCGRQGTLVEESEVITHPMVTRAIGKAQQRVEYRNFEARKKLLEYDDVMNQQREVVYSLRLFALEGGEELKAEVVRMIEGALDHFAEQWGEDPPETWDRQAIASELTMRYLVSAPDILDVEKVPDVEALRQVVKAAAHKAFDAKVLGWDEIGKRNGVDHIADQLLAHVLLSVLDEKWKDHLYDLDQLRNAIQYRAWGQKDPLIEYKQEAFEMFVDLMNDIRSTVADRVFKFQVQFNFSPNPPSATAPGRAERPVSDVDRMMPGARTAPRAPAGVASKAPVPVGGDGSAAASVTARAGGKAVPLGNAGQSVPKVGRNDPCPCGSGKKYKKCHGANA